jgi:RNA polymerase-binding transcription factor DksA
MFEQKVLAQLKSKLESAKLELEKEMAELSKSPDMGSDVDGFDEETDEAEEFSANMGMLESVKERYQSVKDALAKMAAGTYGHCEHDQKEIEPEVLLADPESRYCKACKARLNIKA